MRPILMPARAKARREACAPGPGDFVLVPQGNKKDGVIFVDSAQRKFGAERVGHLLNRFFASAHSLQRSICPVQITKQKRKNIQFYIFIRDALP